ncbi:protein kinase [Planomonospora corallina]|uniref:non-specific serine/threonine protein kinase n=1 Tax=Planomonospora corallina TaxID=1806052 RepID=A0ABV8IA03_9ACTN
MVPGYREVRELGAGSGGRVVLATYAGTGAYVAIKYLNASLRDDERFLARLREQARVLVELDDPHLVRLHEYYEDVLEAALVTELVDGVALRRLLDGHGATSPEAALAVLKGTLLGLAGAHAAGVTHRDFRAEKILVRADGTGKLTGFGFAAPAAEPVPPPEASGKGSPAPPGRTAPETPGWADPAAPGRTDPAGEAADVRAAARVFAECVTGRPYRTGLTTPAGWEPDGPDPLEALPDPVRRLAARGLAEAPSDRPPAARALASELEAVALSVYGPEWERRGRRHLAERATLFALDFPLARPAGRTASRSAARSAARAGASVARHVRGRVGGLRRTRPGSRMLAGAGLAAAAVVVALVAAGPPAGPLASDRVFTPSPGTPREGRPAAPDRSPSGPPDVPEPSRAAAPTTPPGATGPARRPHPAGTAPAGPTAAASRHSPAPEPSGSASDDRGPGTTPPSAPGSASPPGRTPAPSPSDVRPSSVPPHTVDDLAVIAVDATGAVIGVRASGPADVVLTVTFAEGPAADRMTREPARTLTLTGSGSYRLLVPHAFTVPACGQTLLRRVTAETRPWAPQGAPSRTVAVTADPCPASGTPSPGSGDATGDTAGDSAGDAAGGVPDVPEDVMEDVTDDPAGAGGGAAENEDQGVL